MSDLDGLSDFEVVCEAPFVFVLHVCDYGEISSIKLVCAMLVMLGYP